MSISKDSEVQSLRVICHYCGTVNNYGEKFCEWCRALLERGRIVTQEESLKYSIARERQARRRIKVRRGAYILGVALLAAVAAFFVLWFTRSPPVLPSAQSRISIRSVAGQWPTEGFDAQNTRAISESYPPFSGEVKWQLQLGGSVTDSPAVADGVAYISLKEGHVVALNLNTGAILWELTGLGPLSASPMVAGGTLYLGLNSGTLMAIDKDSGATLWSVDLPGGIVTSPTVVDGEVFIGTNGMVVLSLDAATGQERWRQLVDGVVVEPVSVHGDTAVAMTFNGVHFFNIPTGRKVFTYTTFVGGVVGPTVIRDDAIYYARRDGIVQALEFKARGMFGEKTILYWWAQLWVWGMAPQPPSPRGLIWSYRSGNAANSALAVSDRAIYLGLRGGKVVAIDRHEPKQLWSFQTEGQAETAPAVIGDVLYIASGRYLYGLGADTGDLRWRFELADTAACNVAITQQSAIICDKSGNIYAIR